MDISSTPMLLLFAGTALVIGLGVGIVVIKACLPNEPIFPPKPKPPYDINEMRPLKKWEKNYIGSDDPQKIEMAFAKRHKRAAGLFILAFFGSFALDFIGITLFGLSKEEFEALGLPYYFLIIPVAAIYMLVRYRCPRCNAVPTSNKVGTSGILLFPKKCSNCGAPLLPNHRWNQE